MTEITQENHLIDIPDLNRFRIGDHVIVDASADNDRFEGVVIGIELQRLYGSKYLVPSITLLHDGCTTDGFKPSDCRKVYPSPQPNLVVTDELATTYKAAFRALFDRWLNDEAGIPQENIGLIATKAGLQAVFDALATTEGKEG